MSECKKCGGGDALCICNGKDSDCPGEVIPPCVEYQPGMNGRCAWCDHGKECHPLTHESPAECTPE